MIIIFHVLYLSANLMPKHKYNQIVAKKNIQKNTLKARCLSDQEIQQISEGFEHVISQEKEKYQQELQFVQ